MAQHLFRYNHPFITEAGQRINGLEIAYTTKGVMNPHRSNVVWVVHALTANADAAEWWSGLFGSGTLFDTDTYFVVCANNIGSCYGSTGPLSINPDTGSPYYHTFPFLSIRDIAASLQLLAAHLEIDRIQLLIGASMGGQIALEWSISQAGYIKKLLLIATNAAHSAWGIAFNESQRQAIETDPTWQTDTANAGFQGLKTARGIALLSYRNYHTYRLSQYEDSADKTDQFRAASYQRYQGEKLIRRFNAFSYYWLSKAMDSHNVARDRKNAEEALALVKAQTLIININTDILFPLQEQEFLRQHIPQAILYQVRSNYGHDGFLIDAHLLTEHIIPFFSPKTEIKNKRRLFSNFSCY